MFKCKYCGKEFEKSSQLGGHIIWCCENPNKSGKSNYNKGSNKDKRGVDKMRNDLFCQYCNKQCKNLNSLKQHEIRCKENPNRISINTKGITDYNKDRKDKKIYSWNKGLNKYTDERVKKYGETIKNKIKIGEIKNPGGLKNNTVKYCYRHGTYKGIRCDSSWELAFLVYCIEHNIEIERNTNGYEYFVNNKKHLFYPDFLINKKELVEIKGLQDLSWSIKKETYPNIIFLFKKDMVKYLMYVKNKYGNEFWNVLYD